MVLAYVCGRLSASPVLALRRAGVPRLRGQAKPRSSCTPAQHATGHATAGCAASGRRGAPTAQRASGGRRPRARHLRLLCIIGMGVTRDVGAQCRWHRLRLLGDRVARFDIVFVASYGYLGVRATWQQNAQQEMEKSEYHQTSQPQLPGRQRNVHELRDSGSRMTCGIVQPGICQGKQGAQAASGRHLQRQWRMTASGTVFQGKQSLLGVPDAVLLQRE